MQVFMPYMNPFDTARALDKRRLNKQIIECSQILRAIGDRNAPWANHPIVAMWRRFKVWLQLYSKCLQYYRDGYESTAQLYGEGCLDCKPDFLTEEFCVQHRRRLYTKDPQLYAQWARYGCSDENWYYTEDGRLIKYVNGKRI